MEKYPIIKNRKRRVRLLDFIDWNELEVNDAQFIKKEYLEGNWRQRLHSKADQEGIRISLESEDDGAWVYRIA